MTYAPNGPFGSVIHDDMEFYCQKKCLHKIRTPEKKLGKQWLEEHDCDNPTAWKPEDND